MRPFSRLNVSLCTVYLSLMVLLPARVILAQPSDERQEARVRVAEDHFAEFNYVDAARAFRDVLDSDSTDYRALTRITESWNLRGLDLQAAGKKDSAEAAFERAVEYAEQTRRHYPDSARTYVNLAAAYGNLALFRGGKSKVRIGRQVQDYAREALRIDSTNVIAMTILGVFYREVSQLSWIERLLAGVIYGGVPKGSLDDSVEFLERAVAIDSTGLFPNYSLGVTYRRKDMTEAAEAQFEKVLDLKPANSEEARYLSQAREWLEKSARN